MPKTFCVSCKTQTDSYDTVDITTKNGRKMLQGRCSVCHKKKSTFVKNKQDKKTAKMKINVG